MKKNIINISISFVATLFALLLVELSYRAYVYYNYAINAKYPVATIDSRNDKKYFGSSGNVRGNLKPGLSTWTRYDNQGNIFSKIKVHVNNLGWVSRFDYETETNPSEYRIAIIGDSMTASVNNEHPWPDFLQQNLNADQDLRATLGIKKFTVLNLGVAGASLQFMANELSDIAKRLSSNLVVVNFLIEDIARRHGPIRELNARSHMPIQDKPFPSPPADFNFDGVRIWLACVKPPRTLRNPACRVNPRWYVPPNVELVKADLTRIKQKLARRILWHRVILSPKPLALLEILGQPIIPRARAQEVVAITMKSGKEAEDIEIGVKALKTIRSMHGNVIATHNPLYWHLTGKRSKSLKTLDKFNRTANGAGIEIVRMRDYLPVQKGHEEWYRWYNLPHDGHWSDYGAELYARAMHAVVRKHLLSAAGRGQDSIAPTKCEIAFATFIDGREAQKIGKASEAMQAFERALAQLPNDWREVVSGRGTYRDCGFVSDLHLARGDLFLSTQEPEKALAAWGRSLDINPDQLRAYVSRGKLRLNRGDYKGAESDFEAAAKRAREKRHTLYYYLGESRQKAGDDKGAIDAFSKGLEIHPGYWSLLILRGNAYVREKRFEEAVADFTTALDLNKKASAYRGRALAFEGLGKHEEAEADRRAAAAP